MAITPLDWSLQFILVYNCAHIGGWTREFLYLLYRLGPSSRQNDSVNVASSSKNSVANVSHHKLSLSCKTGYIYNRHPQAYHRYQINTCMIQGFYINTILIPRKWFIWLGKNYQQMSYVSQSIFFVVKKQRLEVSPVSTGEIHSMHWLIDCLTNRLND